MKTILIAATLLGVAATQASAREIEAPIPRHLYTCASGGLSRVALKAQPASCCDGLLGCPQLLGNTGLVKPRRPTRT